MNRLLTLILMLAPAVSLAQLRPIGFNEWLLDTTPVAVFSPVREYLEGNTVVMQPSVAQPANCFGFIEFGAASVPGLIDVSPAADTLPGNDCGLRITYRFSRSDAGTAAPDIRLRLNTGDFRQYALTGIGSKQFEHLAENADQTAEVTFDRRLLNDADDRKMRVAIDMLGYDPATDPEFKFTLVSAEFFQTPSNSSASADQLLNAVYMDANSDVYVHAVGSTVPFRIHGGTAPASFASDGIYVVVLDHGNLIGYKSTNGFVPATLEVNKIVMAAISNQHVGAIDKNGQAYYYNLETKERRLFSVAGVAFDFTVGSGDGTLMFLDQKSDHEEIYLYDPSNPAAGLKAALNDNKALIFTTRATGKITLP